MPLTTAQLEAGVHRLERRNAVVFGDQTAGADFTGGDQADAYAASLLDQRTA